MIDLSRIRDRFASLSPYLDERARRLFAATEALSAGYGGIAAAARATGIAVSTIGRGLKELNGETAPAGRKRVRRAGGGRKALISVSPALLSDLLSLVEPTERGDPMSPLRWTCKGTRRLAKELNMMGHKISRTVVGELLHAQRFSLQGNRKTLEGGQSPDRDAQFHHINESVAKAQAASQPVIPVDTKKKELAGDFKNNGKEWRPQRSPEPVRVHDFIIPELGRAVPYGVYDIAASAGWVSVGMSADTAEFAVNTIRRWWHEIGRVRYPGTKYLTITADGGGSNGSRVRLWKRELQRLSNELGIDIAVHHLPPGTSKWNKIEHRLFSFITMNWRGKPLVSYQTIISLIGAATTENGLTVRCEQDETLYQKGAKVTDEEMALINIIRDEFHGEWNYTIKPGNRSDRAVNS